MLRKFTTWRYSNGILESEGIFMALEFTALVKTKVNRYQEKIGE
jgi:hypothetical protein